MTPTTIEAIKRWASRALAVAGAAAIVWVVAHFPLADIADACAQLGPAAAVTPLLALGWFAAGARSLWHLAGRRAPWLVLLRARVIGEGYNALIPAAGLGGEPYKLRVLARHVDTRRAVVALIDDRLIENAVAFAFSAACMGAGAWRLDDAPATVHAAMVAYALAATALAAACAALLVTSATGWIGARLARWLGAGDAAAARMPARALLCALGWTAVARVLGLVEYAVLCQLVGLKLGTEVGIWEVMFVAGATAAAGFVGGVVPQGLGVAEAATVGAFELLHLPGPAGVAVALARRGRQLVTSLAGVLFDALVRARAARRAVQRRGARL